MLTFDGRRHRSVSNIGVRPTVTGSSPAPVTVETHVLDFEQDVYDKDVKLEFLLRLRDERRFPDTVALVAQIRRDVGRARRFFRWAEAVCPSLITDRAAVC
jgi:riboflavin kinase/FMN adenylyltransferase